MPLTRILRRAFVAAATLSLVLAGGAAAKPLAPPVVSSVTVSNASVAPGDGLTATAGVRNPARRHSAKREVSFFLLAAMGAAPRTPQGVAVASGKTPRIAAGATKHVISSGFHVPASTAAGSYYVLACIGGKCKSSLLRVSAITATSTGAGGQDAVYPAELTFGFDSLDVYSVPVSSSGSAFLNLTNIGQATSGWITFEIEPADGETQWSVSNMTCRYLAATTYCGVGVQYLNGPDPGTSHAVLRAFAGGELMRSVDLISTSS